MTSDEIRNKLQEEYAKLFLKMKEIELKLENLKNKEK